MAGEKDFTEEELKEIKRRKQALRKKRVAKRKEMKEKRMRALLEDDEIAELVESPEERCERLYAKGQKKMTFAPHMYRREDQADMYRQAAELFGETAGYEESDALREECLAKAKEHRTLYIEETYALIKKQLASAETLADCHKLQENIHAIADYRDVEAERQACDEIEQRLLMKERNQKIMKMLLLAVVFLGLLFVIVYVQGIL